MGSTSAKSKLEDACKKRQCDIVEQIQIKFPELLNETFVKGGKLNPFIYAVWCGDLAMIKMLTEKKVDVNIECNNGHCGLMWAAIRNRSAILKFLVKNNMISFGN